MNCSIRQPAVAGSFYPGDPAALQRMLETFFAQPGADISLPMSAPKAIISPHAGYIYSGPIAANVYRLLVPARLAIKRVILLGPAHRVPVRGVALSRCEYFQTPFGAIQLDREAMSKIEQLDFVQYNDQAHEYEHSLEVQLPFLQEILDNDFTLVPIVVGEASAAQVAQIIELLWGGNETLIVISSDLSHYHRYDDANSIDNNTVKIIERSDENKLQYDMACGAGPIRGLLRVARMNNLDIKTVDVRNSGDTAGDKDRVVGYGGFALYEQT